MDGERIKENKLEWYVMRSRNTGETADNIKKINQRAKELERIEDFFVPAVLFQDAQKQKRPPEEIKMGRTLRRFVFLKIRPSGLTALSEQDWQNAPDSRLYHYRDHEGIELTASDSMMERFRIACEEYGNKFEIVTLPSAPKEIEEGITVKLVKEPFANVNGEVIHVHHVGDEVILTVAVKIFGGTYAKVNDLKKDDVVISDEDAPVFNLRFMDEVEAFLLEVLRQKNKKKRDKQEEDKVLNKRPLTKAEEKVQKEAERKAEEEAVKKAKAIEKQLRDYYRLCNATFADEAVRDRFDALMSICATLLQSTAGKKRYNWRLKQRIKALREMPESTVSQTSIAWQLTALFVSTHDADYRTELKSIIPTISPRPEPLCRFLSVIRHL